MANEEDDDDDLHSSLSRMYMEHWQRHGGLNTPPPRNEQVPFFPFVSGFYFGYTIALIGCILNLILIVILFRKRFSPIAWFSIGIAFCDFFSCLAYAVGEIFGSMHHNIRWNYIGCGMIISKPYFWSFWALRMGIIVMQSWYLFTQLVFPAVYRGHGRRSKMLGMFVFYALQAWLAHFVHSLTTENGRYQFCYEAMDMFRLYGDEVGNHKLLVAAHISIGFIVPIMFTRFLYDNMLGALVESPNANHLLTYNAMQKIYFMDNLLPAFIWGPFFFLFFVFHFGSFFEFTQYGMLHRLTFGAGLTYHALYPLLCLFIKREVGGHLMGNLDVSKGHWVIAEDDDREEFFGNTVERIPTPWSSSQIRPPTPRTKEKDTADASSFSTIAKKIWPFSADADSQYYRESQVKKQKKKKWEAQPEVTWGEIAGSFLQIFKKSSPVSRGMRIDDEWNMRNSDLFIGNGLNDFSLHENKETNSLPADLIEEPKSDRARMSLTVHKSESAGSPVKWNLTSKIGRPGGLNSSSTDILDSRSSPLPISKGESKIHIHSKTEHYPNALNITQTHQFDDEIDAESSMENNKPVHIAHFDIAGLDDDIKTPSRTVISQLAPEPEFAELPNRMGSRDFKDELSEPSFETLRPQQKTKSVAPTQHRTSWLQRIFTSRYGASACEPGLENIDEFISSAMFGRSSEACTESTGPDHDLGTDGCISIYTEEKPLDSSRCYHKGETIITICPGHKSSTNEAHRIWTHAPGNDIDVGDGPRSKPTKAKKPNHKHEDHTFCDDAMKTIECQCSSHFVDSMALSSCIEQTTSANPTHACTSTEQTLAYGKDASLGVSIQIPKRPSPRKRSNKRFPNSATTTQCMRISGIPGTECSCGKPAVSLVSSHKRQKPASSHSQETKPTYNQGTDARNYTDDEIQRFQARLGMTPGQNDDYYVFEESIDSRCSKRCHRNSTPDSHQSKR